MKLLVRLHRDIPEGLKPVGIPDSWPAEIQEVSDEYVSVDERIVMTFEEYSEYYDSVKPLYDAWILPVLITDHRVRAYSAIDSHVDRLISQGFSFNQKTLSLSVEAQSKLQGYQHLPDQFFPITVSTLDDSDTITLASRNEAENAYITAMSTLHSYISVGTELKSLVRTATTAAEIEDVLASLAS